MKYNQSPDAYSYPKDIDELSELCCFLGSRPREYDKRFNFSKYKDWLAERQKENEDIKNLTKVSPSHIKRAINDGERTLAALFDNKERENGAGEKRFNLIKSYLIYREILYEDTYSVLGRAKHHLFHSFTLEANLKSYQNPENMQELEGHYFSYRPALGSTGSKDEGYLKDIYVKTHVTIQFDGGALVTRDRDRHYIKNSKTKEFYQWQGLSETMTLKGYLWPSKDSNLIWKSMSHSLKHFRDGRLKRIEASYFKGLSGAIRDAWGGAYYIRPVYLVPVKDKVVLEDFKTVQENEYEIDGSYEEQWGFEDEHICMFKKEHLSEKELSELSEVFEFLDRYHNDKPIKHFI